MLAASELIKEKRYAEARVILRTINDPLAREWLAKLDRIAPAKNAGTGGGLRYLAVFFTVLLFLLVGVLIALPYLRGNSLFSASGEPTSSASIALVVTSTPLERPTLPPTWTPIPVTSTPNPADCPAEAWLAANGGIIDEFMSVVLATEQVYDVDLPPYVDTLVRLRQRFQDNSAPDCVREAKGTMLVAMQTAISALTSFASGQIDPDRAGVRLEAVWADYDRVLTQLEALGITFDVSQRFIPIPTYTPAFGNRWVG